MNDTPSTALTVGGQYTEILTYTLTSSNALQLASQLYTGTGTNTTTMSGIIAATVGRDVSMIRRDGWFWTAR